MANQGSKMFGALLLLSVLSTSGCISNFSDSFKKEVPPDGTDQGLDSGPNSNQVRVKIKVLLQGPYDASSLRMKGILQAKGLLPNLEPYSALGYAHKNGGGGEMVDSSILANGDSNGVQDWIVVELRNPLSPDQIVATRSALLLKSGMVVDLDGVSDVLFSNLAPDNYNVAVFHRNHLGAMTLDPQRLSHAASLIDLSDPAVPTFGGTNGRLISGPVALLYSGDINRSGSILYSGGGNDRDLILFAIGGVVVTNVVSGYRSEDLNLDGDVKYTGADNDRDLILLNTGSLPGMARYGVVP